MDLEFEWDPEKAETNEEKHGIKFQDAIRVFLDPNHLLEPAKQDFGEKRFTVIGKVKDRELLLVFTYRQNKVRIISARRAHQNERRKYRQG